MSKEESNACRMPELEDFDIIYSAVGKLVVVKLVMKDSMAGHIEDTHDFPDLQISMRSSMARELANGLLKCSDAIDEGNNHPSIRFVD
ncbi:hypothetical protein [Mixta calida]|uniref:hypothetical protein n=1 Tax=Mixta calida TaxID=665913 RepID=UPI0028995B4E|nr:hypothetical protein [Mixta calida]